MCKRILAIYYSQSGQLGQIINNITQPLINTGSVVETVKIAPAKEYPFPWNGKQFFSVMPDCVLGNTIQLAPFEIKEQKYDLVILGYQPWFLSPSLPVNALMQQMEFKNILKETPVITVTGVRNMWINSFQKLKKMLQQNNANLVGNIVLEDKHHNLISLITILYWMFKGKKDKYLGIFPKPGVSDEDIENAKVFGEVIQQHLEQNSWDLLQNDLVSKKAVEVKYNLMFIEEKASRIFPIWANFISKRKNKTFWLVLFKYYLLIALFVVAPIILAIDAIFFKPFLSKKIAQKKEYYSGVK